MEKMNSLSIKDTTNEITNKVTRIKTKDEFTNTFHYLEDLSALFPEFTA